MITNRAAVFSVCVSVYQSTLTTYRFGHTHATPNFWPHENDVKSVYFIHTEMAIQWSYSMLFAWWRKPLGNQCALCQISSIFHLIKINEISSARKYFETDEYKVDSIFSHAVEYAALQKQHKHIAVLLMKEFSIVCKKSEINFLSCFPSDFQLKSVFIWVDRIWLRLHVKLHMISINKSTVNPIIVIDVSLWFS